MSETSGEERAILKTPDSGKVSPTFDGGSRDVFGQVAGALDDLVTSLFRTALWIVLGVAAIDMAMVPLGAARAHVARSLIVGACLVSVVAVALVRRDRVLLALRSHPFLLLVPALLGVAALWADGSPNSPHLPVTGAAIAIPATLGQLRWALASVALLTSGYLAGVATWKTDAPIDRLAADTVAGNVLVYCVVAAIVAGPIWIFVREAHRGIVREGPGLTGEGAGEPGPLGPATPPLLVDPPIAREPAAQRVARLTPAQLRLVALMCEGLAPKQAAQELHISVHTVRTQLKRAKRATGARTLSELVSLVAGTRTDAPPGKGS